MPYPKARPRPKNEKSRNEVDNSSLENPKAKPRPTNEKLKNLEMEEFKVYKKSKTLNYQLIKKKSKKEHFISRRVKTLKKFSKVKKF